MNDFSENIWINDGLIFKKIKPRLYHIFLIIFKYFRTTYNTIYLLYIDVQIYRILRKCGMKFYHLTLQNLINKICNI